jgi:hypothetical protein
MSIILWILQIILGIKFLTTAYSHALQPNNQNMKQSIEKLGSAAVPLHRLFSVIMFAVSFTIILPGLIHWSNWITVISAAVLAVLMLLSIPLHIRSREKPVIVADIVLLALCLAVAYGRWVIFPL